MTERPNAPRPLLRRGPRPLLLHLSLAMLSSTVSLAVSPRSKSGLWPLKERAEAERIVAALERAGAGTEAAFAAQVWQALFRQQAALIAGIAAYRRHPWRRELADPPAIWEEGGSRLLDYGGTGPPVLFVPSLVNRAYVLDLAPGHSMLRFLAEGGMRVLLLDWGWPGEIERRFTLTDYIAGRLERAIAAAPAPPILAGYCMGGNLALAAALRRPDRVRALALLATPWDFHAADPDRAQALAGLLPLYEPAFAFADSLPVDFLQTLFALLDPYAVAAKYRSFARLDPALPRARLFVALEDWLNDGIPLAAPVARECLADWYGANTPARLAWRVAGLAVDPAALSVPAFVAIPSRDRIVPPESAAPLAAAIPGARAHYPAAGHIGMAAGSNAAKLLWKPLAEWVAGL